MAAEHDEFERGYPRMTLSLLLDVVGACHARADRPSRESGRAKAKDAEDDEPSSCRPRDAKLDSPEGIRSLRTRMHAAKPASNAISWRALLGKLGRLNRLKVFYSEQTGPEPIKYSELLRPGRVSVVDLSDSGASELNNLVIADLLRGVQDAQDDAYSAYELQFGHGPKVVEISGRSRRCVHRLRTSIRPRPESRGESKRTSTHSRELAASMRLWRGSHRTPRRCGAV